MIKMRGSNSYIWLILMILMIISLYNLFGSETEVPEPEPEEPSISINQEETRANVLTTSISNNNLNNNNNILTEDALIQRRLQNAEEIWVRGVKNREAALKVSKLNESNPYGMVHYRVLWDFFYPDYNCPHNLERLGRVGDGGKWICGIPQLARKNGCLVYSYGIAGDTSFEKDILERTNCSVHGYDHTIKTENVKLPKDYPGRATVSKLGIGFQDTKNLRTLKSEMNARGHTFIDVLKMDVEGAEFKALEQIIQDFPNGLPFGQLVIEIHLTAFRTDLFKTFKSWWEKLEGAGLRAFHSEPNLYIFAMSDKKRNPFCYEYSFINVKVDHAVLHA